MENTCTWCNQQAPHLQAVKITTLLSSNDHPVAVPHEISVCKKCEEELKEYESAWEVLSH